MYYDREQQDVDVGYAAAAAAEALCFGRASDHLRMTGAKYQTVV